MTTEVERTRAALLEACELLEGWIKHCCPRQHRPEHMRKLKQLRSAAEVDGCPVVLLKVMPVARRRPDADTDVILFDSAHEVRQLGAYMGDDENGQIWVDVHGRQLSDKVLHWCDLPRLP